MLIQFVVVDIPRTVSIHPGVLEEVEGEQDISSFVLGCVQDMYRKALLAAAFGF
jgi:hypothetical protein